MRTPNDNQASDSPKKPQRDLLKEFEAEHQRIQSLPGGERVKPLFRALNKEAVALHLPNSLVESLLKADRIECALEGSLGRKYEAVATHLGVCVRQVPNILERLLAEVEAASDGTKTNRLPMPSLAKLDPYLAELSLRDICFRQVQGPYRPASAIVTDVKKETGARFSEDKIKEALDGLLRSKHFERRKDQAGDFEYKRVDQVLHTPVPMTDMMYQGRYLRVAEGLPKVKSEDVITKEANLPPEGVRWLRSIIGDGEALEKEGVIFSQTRDSKPPEGMKPIAEPTYFAGVALWPDAGTLPWAVASTQALIRWNDPEVALIGAFANLTTQTQIDDFRSQGITDALRNFLALVKRAEAMGAPETRKKFVVSMYHCYTGTACLPSVPSKAQNGLKQALKKAAAACLAISTLFLNSGRTAGEQANGLQAPGVGVIAYETEAARVHVSSDLVAEYNWEKVVAAGAYPSTPSGIGGTAAIAIIPGWTKRPEGTTSTRADTFAVGPAWAKLAEGTTSTCADTFAVNPAWAKLAEGTTSTCADTFAVGPAWAKLAEGTTSTRADTFAVGPAWAKLAEGTTSTCADTFAVNPAWAKLAEGTTSTCADTFAVNPAWAKLAEGTTSTCADTFAVNPAWAKLAEGTTSTRADTFAVDPA
jgi:hypothetical protein